MAVTVTAGGLGLAGTAYAAPPPPPHRDLGRQYNSVQECQAEARREHRPIDCRIGPDHRHWHLWG